MNTGVWKYVKKRKEGEYAYIHEYRNTGVIKYGNTEIQDVPHLPDNLVEAESLSNVFHHPDPERLLDGHQRHHQDNHQHHHHLPQQYCLPKNQHNHHYDLVMTGLVCCHCPAGSCPLSHSRVTLPVTQADPENCRRSF